MNRFAEGARFGALVSSSDYRPEMHRLRDRPIGDLE